MGSKQRGKERKWEREHSLPPHHYDHCCRECSHFFSEFPDIGFMNKNYCNKWIKNVDPYQDACKSFGFRIKPTLKKKRTREVRTEEKAKKEGSQRNRWRKIHETTIKPPNIIVSVTPISSKPRGTTPETYPVISGIQWPYKPVIPPMGLHSGGGGRRPHGIIYGVPSSSTAKHGWKTGSKKTRRKKKKNRALKSY